jgi:MFS family permease
LSTPSTISLLRSMPIWPLAATLAVQTLATMALYSLPAVAPEVAADLHVNGTLVGSFVATAYGVGILSALLSPGMVRKYGGVRATQAVLAGAAGMLALASIGSGVAGLALAAVVLGIGYGAAAPASTHLLVPQTPPPVFNLVMSLRQIGVPFGGVMAALILPPLVPLIGWRGALLAELGPVLLLILLMEIPRRRWDVDRDPGRRVFGRSLWQPFSLLAEQRFRRLSVAAFVYAGLALCLVAFMTVQLTTVVGLSLVAAGQVLAQPPGLGLDRRPAADAGTDPGGAWRRHGGRIGADRAVRPRFPALGGDGERGAGRVHLRRLHRRCLCRVRRAGRVTTNRGNGAGNGDPVRRRDGRAAGVRRSGHRAGRIPRQLHGRRRLRGLERGAAGAAGAGAGGSAAAGLRETGQGRSGIGAKSRCRRPHKRRFWPLTTCHDRAWPGHPRL